MCIYIYIYMYRPPTNLRVVQTLDGRFRDLE